MKALCILVVEDDALIAALLAELLVRMGHRICAIEATEADAVAAAFLHRPQMMIVDVILGSGSGVAAMDEISHTASIPHVFVSGDVSALRILRPNAITLQKPYRPAELSGAMQRALAM
jgi:two-component system, response regulator PdtaR